MGQRDAWPGLPWQHADTMDMVQLDAWPSLPWQHADTVDMVQLDAWPSLIPGAVRGQANWLKSVGVRTGDAVAIYLPLICELPSAPRPRARCAVSRAAPGEQASS